jgi:hypothetical protein
MNTSDGPEPPGSERGQVVARFATDPREQRTLARVRAICALLAAGAASLTLFGKLPIPAFLVALLGLAISLLWLRQARRAAASARRSNPEALVVHALGFALDEGERTHWVPWRNVVSVEVDEERLDIVVQQTGATSLRIEPRYPGVEIHELMRTLDDARQSAQGLVEPGSSAPRR